jgi:hypothetical protein
MAILRQPEHLSPTPSKSLNDLAGDALWFCIHALLAVLFLALVWTAITLLQPDPDSNSPKIFATALAFLIPMLGGFLIARTQHTRRRILVARYVWISGLFLFAAVSVWVLDLPTGPGLCEACGPIEKLWRTFFSLNHGSGLMGGDGLLIGTWPPLAMIGYAAGATLAR